MRLLLTFVLNALLIPVNLIGFVLILPAFIYALFLTLLVKLGLITGGVYNATFIWLTYTY